jgi:hypothetical protein
MMENRVRKLMKEEERLKHQIEIANKNSDIADMARERVEYEQRFKAMQQQAERERIEVRRKLNEERKKRS